MSMGSNKSSDPDGLTIEYIKKMWTIIHQDFFQMVKEFCCMGKFPSGLISSFICLIPKLDNLVTDRDFRPISLINCPLKIFLKALSVRLGKCLPLLVSDVQSSFMKNRNIMETFLIVEEVVHSIKLKQVKGFIIKVDLLRKHSILLVGTFYLSR